MLCEHSAAWIALEDAEAKWMLEILLKYSRRSDVGYDMILPLQLRVPGHFPLVLEEQASIFAETSVAASRRERLLSREGILSGFVG